MNARDFEDFIIEHKVVGVFNEPITLKSGKKSHFYVNWRTASNDAFLLDMITDHIVASLKKQPIQPESIYGVPEGASKLAIITMMKWAKSSGDWIKGRHTVAMGRGKVKTHGQANDQRYIGTPTGRVWVIEDTITTGLSVFQTVDQLLADKVEVVGICCLCDRMERDDEGRDMAAKVLHKYGNQISYLPLSRADHLLERLLTSDLLTTDLQLALKKEFTISPRSSEHNPQTR